MVVQAVFIQVPTFSAYLEYSVCHISCGHLSCLCSVLSALSLGLFVNPWSNPTLSHWSQLHSESGRLGGRAPPPVFQSCLVLGFLPFCINFRNSSNCLAEPVGVFLRTALDLQTCLQQGASCTERQRAVSLKSMVPQLPGFKSWLHPSVTTWPWRIYLTWVCLSLLTCKIGIITVPTL